MKKNNDKYLRNCNYFCIIGTLLLILFSVAFFLNPNIYTTLLHGDNVDSFMDYFNSISHSLGRRPYDIQAIYPPLCYVIYWLMGVIMGEGAQEILSNHGANQIDLKLYTLPMLVFLAYFIVTLIIFVILAFKLKQGEFWQRIWFLVTICLSVPFMFQFQRANIIFISLLGTMAFFLWKDSENKYLREFALICLALSAALKIYPAIFGFALLKEKRYKETFRLVIYGVLCFFVPFLFIRGGFNNIPKFIENLIYTSTVDQAKREGYKLSYSALISYIFEKINQNSLLSQQIGEKSAFAIAFLSMCAFPWVQKQWKSILLLTCLLVGVPNMSYTYTAIFFVVPLILFLNSKEEGRLRYIYLVLFILILFPLPLGWNSNSGVENYYIFNRSLNTLQISSAVLVMTVLLICEGVWSFYKKMKKHKCIYCGLVVIVIGFVVTLTSIYIQSSYISKKIDQTNAIKQKTLKKYDTIFFGIEYSGTYIGAAFNDIPEGKGTFVVGEDKSGFQIVGEWENGKIDGWAKVVYPNQSYDLVRCKKGMPYGKFQHYNENDELLFTDWYYDEKTVSQIQKAAIEVDYNMYQAVESTNPTAVFKFYGKVKEIIQFKSWVEIIVQDTMGKEYLVVYENGVIGKGNHSVVSELEVGNEAVFWGMLTEISEKGVPKFDIIAVNEENAESETHIETDTYESVKRNPCIYAGTEASISGEVVEIKYDYVLNTIVYTVESNVNKGRYCVGIEMQKVFSDEYDLPIEEKKAAMDVAKKQLPGIGESIKVYGEYAGNYIVDDNNRYLTTPYIRVVLEKKDNLTTLRSGSINSNRGGEKDEYFRK